MKSIAILFAFVLAIDAASHYGYYQYYEEVKPFVFPYVNVPVVPSSRRYVETEYVLNLKPHADILDCHKNEFKVHCDENELLKADPDLFEISKKYCLSSFNHMLEAYELFCESTRRFAELPTPSELSTPPATPIETERSQRERRSLDKFFDERPELKRFTSTLKAVSCKLRQQHEKAISRLSKLNDLNNTLASGKQPSIDELRNFIDFSSLSNLTKFARFHKFKSCRFNKTDSTFRVNLLEANVISNKLIIKPDPFRFVDDQKCLVSYVGPEMFVYDSSNQTYCPLERPFLELIEGHVDKKTPLDDPCQPFSKPELLFLKNCTARYEQKDLKQIKAYPLLYLYGYGSKIQINNATPIDLPNSVISIASENLKLIFDGRMMQPYLYKDRSRFCVAHRYLPFMETVSNPGRWCAVKFDGETNEKLVSAFHAKIITALT